MIEMMFYLNWTEDCLYEYSGQTLWTLVHYFKWRQINVCQNSGKNTGQSTSPKEKNSGHWTSII